MIPSSPLVPSTHLNPAPRKSGFTLLLMLIVVAFIIAGFFLVVRFGFGESEDLWICDNGEWVAHGNPSEIKPNQPCNNESAGEKTNSTGTRNNSDEKTIFVYFSNSSLAGDTTDCGIVFSVTRIVPQDLSPKEILTELFTGPTEKERQDGFTSLFSSKTRDSVISVKIDKNTAYVNLKDIRQTIPNASASCGSKEFMSEIGETLRNNLKVEKVIYAINGSPQTFYEWVQLGCSEENNNCDARAFQ